VQIQAAVVRIMKARKALSHNDLIAESSKQLQHRFNPDPKLVRKQIEALIEQAYLERDTTNHQAYRYLA
jgi:cullin 3